MSRVKVYPNRASIITLRYTYMKLLPCVSHGNVKVAVLHDNEKALVRNVFFFVFFVFFFFQATQLFLQGVSAERSGNLYEGSQNP